MRKIVIFNRITLDGFFAGPNGEIDWFIPDSAIDQAVHQRMRPDTLLFGGTTYRMFVSFWPQVAVDPNAPQEAKTMANELNEMNKVVFSRTLDEVNWVNSRLVKGDLIEEVRRLKQGEGADITIFGSGTIVQQLANAGLIDEYLIALTPVVLGAGKPLFQGVKKMNLKLFESRDFPSGNVLLHYQMDKHEDKRG
jgi:dihydrofolate reductase